jgi:hypothetical protein
MSSPATGFALIESVHTRRTCSSRGRETSIDQPPAPIARHRAAIILRVDGKERIELAAIGQASDELAHPTRVAGSGSSGQRLPVPASVRLIAGSAPRDLRVAIARRGRRRGATRLGHRREQSQQPAGEVQRPAELDAAVGQAGERSAAHGRRRSR